MDELFPGASAPDPDEPPDEVRLDIGRCRACGQPHYDQVVRRVTRSRLTEAGYTHGYRCDRTGRQMLVRLAKGPPEGGGGSKPWETGGGDEPWKG